jgi:hypothetical protein
MRAAQPADPERDERNDQPFDRDDRSAGVVSCELERGQREKTRA